MQQKIEYIKCIRNNILESGVKVQCKVLICSACSVGKGFLQIRGFQTFFSHTSEAKQKI